MPMTPSFFRFKTADPIIIEQGYPEAFRLYQLGVENPLDNTYKDEWNLKYIPDFDVFDNWYVTKDLPTNPYSECYLLIFVHGSIITNPDLTIIEVPAPKGKKIIKKNISSPGCITTMIGAKLPTYSKISAKNNPDKYTHVPTYISKITSDLLDNFDTCYTKSEWIESANKISLDDSRSITTFLEPNPEKDRACLIQEYQPTYALKHYTTENSSFDQVNLYVKTYNEDGTYWDVETYDLLDEAGVDGKGVSELIEKWYDESKTGIPINRFISEPYNGYKTGLKASILNYSFDTYQLFSLLSILRFNTIHVLDHSCNNYRKLTGEPPKRLLGLPPTIPITPDEIPIGIGYTGYGMRRSRRHIRNIKRRTRKNIHKHHKKNRRGMSRLGKHRFG